MGPEKETTAFGAQEWLISDIRGSRAIPSAA